MALSVPSLLTEGGSTTNATSYATASITVAADDLILVAVFGSLVASINPAPPPTDISGAGLTFDQITQGQNDPTWDNCSLWRAQAASGNSGALTINWANSQEVCRWAVIQYTGQALGSNGAAAIKAGNTQTSYQQTSGTDHSLVMNPLSAVANHSFAVFYGDRVGSATPATATWGGSFTEVSDGGTGEAGPPTLSLCITTGYRVNASNPSVTWSTAVLRAGVAVEIVESNLVSVYYIKA